MLDFRKAQDQVRKHLRDQHSNREPTDFEIWAQSVRLQYESTLAEEDAPDGYELFCADPSEGNPWAERLMHLSPDQVSPRILYVGTEDGIRSMLEGDQRVEIEPFMKLLYPKLKEVIVRPMTCLKDFWRVFLDIESGFSQANSIPAMIVTTGTIRADDSSDKIIEIGERLYQISRRWKIVNLSF
jgi:hypothetical protein